MKRQESTLGRLAAYADDQCLDVFWRWHLAHDDANAKSIIDRLYRAWKRWPASERLQLLEDIEAVVTQDPPRPASDSDDPRRHRRYRQAAAASRDAARLALELSTLWPPTPDGRSAAVYRLTALLLEFAWNGLEETSAPSDPILNKLRTHAAFKKLGTSRASNELVGQLISLRCGLPGEPLNESTIRRKRTRRPHIPKPAAKIWGPNWRMVSRAMRLKTEVGPVDKDLFRPAFQEFIRRRTASS